ncbi:MAG: EamA family transporter [Anaerolineales bacterium]|nr:EamA family transporter [Anaerolineales bacterium]
MTSRRSHPSSLAGLRHSLAALALLRFALRPPGRAGWTQLVIVGLLFSALTHGAQFVALSHLPAATANLALNLSGIVVARLGMASLAERPASRQWAGHADYAPG